MNKTINKFKRHDDRLVGEKKAGGEEGIEDIRMGMEGPKRQAYDKGKRRQRSSLVSSCSSCAVSQRRELFLTDVLNQR